MSYEIVADFLYKGIVTFAIIGFLAVVALPVYFYGRKR